MAVKLLALLLACLPLLAQAQAYPTRPVRVIVPLAPGGTGNTLARMMSEEMGKILGQAFVVENRAGSGGVIGTETVAKSPPDGYTLLLASPSHVINPALRPNYDIYWMNVATGKRIRLTYAPGADVLPVFSPDGTKLMWTSTRDGTLPAQLYVADFRAPG